MQKQLRRFVTVVAGIAMIAGPPPMGTVEAAGRFADPAFGTTWRTGETAAPNFWGPLTTAREGQQEQYLYGGSVRSRLVQYFDKGRMERFDNVTDQPGTKVTSGLLATELITGQIQIADDQFTPKAPPRIPIAGDANAPGVTYAALAGAARSLLDPATGGVGTRVSTGLTATGDLAGGVLPANPGTTIGAYDEVTKHNVTRAFAEYRTRAGLTNIGHARSEPFAATFKVGGRDAEVIVQVFERRVLTYTASNQPQFQVEMGNIGQHYYRWRYETGNNEQPAALSSQQPTATTAPTTAAAAATATPTTAPTATIRPATLPAAALAPTAVTVRAAATPRPRSDKFNCSDFLTQAEAQAYLLMYPGDPSRLDQNNNGVACKNDQRFR